MGQNNSMPWDQAIAKVLKENKRSMRYDEIADIIVETGMRSADRIGATPATTVNSYLRQKLQEKVVCVRRGEYIWKEYLAEDPTLANAIQDNQSEDENDEMGDALITAYGRFWDRKQFEKNGMKLYGTSVKTRNADCIDLSNHAGIYLLHKGYEVIYVGQAKQLIKRLEDHMKDDKRNRWDNFSWFSINALDDRQTPEGTNIKTFEGDALLDTLEALLIETLGPARNKKVGNDFEDKEFEQISETEFLKRERKSR